MTGTEEGLCVDIEKLLEFYKTWQFLEESGADVQRVLEWMALLDKKRQEEQDAE